MEVYNTILGVVQVLLISVTAYIIKKDRDNSAKEKEVDRKLDLLVRMTAQHDIFLDSVKKKQEEYAARNRKVR